MELKYAGEEKTVLEHYSVSGVRVPGALIHCVWGGIWESLFFFKCFRRMIRSGKFGNLTFLTNGWREVVEGVLRRPEGLQLGIRAELKGSDLK